MKNQSAIDSDPRATAAPKSLTARLVPPLGAVASAP